MFVGAAGENEQTSVSLASALLRRLCERRGPHLVRRVQVGILQTLVQHWLFRILPGAVATRTNDQQSKIFKDDLPLFVESKTARFLEDAGILVFLEQVWLRINVYANKALL